MPDSSANYGLPQSRRTAGEWLHQLLALITASRSMADLSVGAVQETTGLALEARGDGRFGTAEQLTPDWNFRLKKDEEEGFDPRLEFSFFPVSDPLAPMTDIGQVDFDAFAATLTGAGFTEQTSYGEHGQVIEQHFSRDQLRVTVLTRGDTASPPQAHQHRYIETVIVR